jgi:hypothetical protein
MSEITLVEAVTQALAHELQTDERVMLLGEDIGANGGVFRATAGLQERFGTERVVDTPLAETLIAGMSIGLAAQGLRPVAEIQFMGFIYPAIDQLLNRGAPQESHLRQAQLPDGAPLADRRRHSCARASLRHRGAVRAHPWLASRDPPRRPAPTACCSRRFATPIPSCSSSRRGSTGWRKKKCPIAATRCRSTSASCCAKAKTSRS